MPVGKFFTLSDVAQRRLVPGFAFVLLSYSVEQFVVECLQLIEIVQGVQTKTHPRMLGNYGTRRDWPCRVLI